MQSCKLSPASTLESQPALVRRRYRDYISHPHSQPVITCQGVSPDPNPGFENDETNCASSCDSVVLLLRYILIFVYELLFCQTFMMQQMEVMTKSEYIESTCPYHHTPSRQDLGAQCETFISQPTNANSFAASFHRIALSMRYQVQQHFNLGQEFNRICM